MVKMFKVGDRVRLSRVVHRYEGRVVMIRPQYVPNCDCDICKMANPNELYIQVTWDDGPETTTRMTLLELANVQGG